MKRLLLLVAALVAATCFSRSASAQFGGMNFGDHTPIGETIQQQRQEILSQQQKYAHPNSRAAAPAQRFQPSGRVDAVGRMDLSGRSVPGYPTLRDGSPTFSRSRYSYSRAVRRPVVRPQAPSPYSAVGSRRYARIPAPPKP